MSVDLNEITTPQTVVTNDQENQEAEPACQEAEPRESETRPEILGANSSMMP